MPLSIPSPKAVVASVAALTFKGEPWTGAVAVSVQFVLPRPKGQLLKSGAPSPKAPRWPVVKPDGDKLERCVWDALVKARVLRDDALIVKWEGAKFYDVTLDDSTKGWGRLQCGVYVCVRRLP
jgi:Holliday junction resolvase RusA-like endonuclease